MQLVSYLFFKDNAAEAFDFYAHCLGGQIAMKVTMGDMSGVRRRRPPATSSLMCACRWATPC